MAEVNYPYPADLVAPFPAHPVDAVCANFDKLKVDSAKIEDIWAKTALGVHIFSPLDATKKCWDLKAAMTPGPVDLKDGYGWNYMACNEMIEPQNTNGVTDMFYPELYDSEEWLEYCMNNFGELNQPAWILDYFGGRRPNLDFKDHTNIIFSNGQFDPWHIGGVLQQIGDPKENGLHMIWIEKSAHHFDLRASVPEADPQSVTDARIQESIIINQFVDQYNQAKKNPAYKPI